MQTLTLALPEGRRSKAGHPVKSPSNRYYEVFIELRLTKSILLLRYTLLPAPFVSCLSPTCNFQLYLYLCRVDCLLSFSRVLATVARCYICINWTLKCFRLLVCVNSSYCCCRLFVYSHILMVIRLSPPCVGAPHLL